MKSACIVAIALMAILGPRHISGGKSGEKDGNSGGKTRFDKLQRYAQAAAELQTELEEKAETLEMKEKQLNDLATRLQEDLQELLSLEKAINEEAAKAEQECQLADVKKKNLCLLMGKIREEEEKVKKAREALSKDTKAIHEAKKNLYERQKQNDRLAEELNREKQRLETERQIEAGQPDNHLAYAKALAVFQLLVTECKNPKDARKCAAEMVHPKSLSTSDLELVDAIMAADAKTKPQELLELVKDKDVEVLAFLVTGGLLEHVYKDGQKYAGIANQLLSELGKQKP